YIPFHLVTRESFSQLQRRLSPDGMLALHMEAVGADDPLLTGIAATLRQVFPNVQAVPASVFDNGLTNYVIFCSRRPLEPSQDPAPLDPSEAIRWQQRWDAWNRRLTPTPGVVLTDDHNPVDLWAERLNLAERQLLHRYYGSEGVSW
ncbi:MAG: fused MFS/spermidine synthase, partial [Candidatus Eremiobacterota bacterium]